MAYTREELDWIEAEWVYHVHGRVACLSSEDFRQVQTWEQEGIQAECLIRAMGSYFERRSQRPRPRAFVALSHLDKEVRKRHQQTKRLALAGPQMDTGDDWSTVRPPLANDPSAHAAFQAWKRARQALPAEDAPGYLESFDCEREARQTLMDQAEDRMPSPDRDRLKAELENRLRATEILPDSPIWKRAFRHHWQRILSEYWQLPVEA